MAAITISRAAQRCIILPASPAHDTLMPGWRPFGILLGGRGVIAGGIPILAPFPYVSLHVEQSKRIGLFSPNWICAVAVPDVPRHASEAGLIISRIVFSFGSG